MSRAKNIKSGNIKRSKFYYPYVFGIIVFTLFIFLKSLNNDFLNWDDDGYVVNNIDITSLSFANIQNFFTKFYLGNYHPLTMLSYSIDYALGGATLNARVFHTTNLILHLFNIFLIYILSFKLFKRIEIAIISALFFAIHPMHVESVAWIAERKDLLYSFFYLAALIFYINYLQNKNKSLFFILALFSFLLSLLSKSMAVTLPLVLLLVDYLLQRKFSFRIVLEKIPFLLLSLAFGIVALISQKDSGAINQQIVNTSFVDRFFMLNYSISFYIVKLIAPFKLAALHSFPAKVNGFLPAIYYLSPLIVITIIFIVIRAKAVQRILIFGLLFFLVSISVVLMVVPVGKALVSERYTYLPYTGFFFICGHIYCLLKDRIIKANKQVVQGYVFALVVFAILFSVKTFNRLDFWKDNITFYDDIINKYPADYYAYVNRGNAKDDIGDYDNAMQDYNKAIELNPKDDMAFNNRAQLKNRLGLYNEAIEDFNIAVKLKPSSEYAFYNRALAKMSLKDFKGAIYDCSQALAINKSLEPAYITRAIARKNNKEFQDAFKDYNEALSLNPSNFETWYNRGNLKLETKDYNGAYNDFSKALSIKNDIPQAFNNRATARLKLNDLTGACSDWHNALALGLNEANYNIQKYCK
ncbi:MAG: tetratricopeptide repeat protein [Bacteroidales bacterium]|nr:tetratricopeptide repeat protein [Bacteroidales bacterium]